MTRPLPEVLAEIDALLAKATPGEWMVYDSNFWRRIGIRGGYQEILWPCVANDGHPDLSGKNREPDLAYLMALQNAYPQLREAAQDRERMREALEALLAERDADVITTEGTAIARAALARKEP